MKKLKYVDEKTFKGELVEFSDKHYNLATKIHESSLTDYPLIVTEDKKRLCFAVDLSNNRVEREFGKNVFKIIIEELYSE